MRKAVDCSLGPALLALSWHCGHGSESFLLCLCNHSFHEGEVSVTTQSPQHLVYQKHSTTIY